MDDALILFGGSVKALNDTGKIGGHLVLFGTADEPDASRFRDYFTPDTDFGPHKSTPILYAHGLDPVLRKKPIGLGNLKADDLGIWLDGQLNLRDDYERAIFGMVKAGKLGYSSGTMASLIVREKQDNGAHKMLSWPLGLDASLTPCPCDPRTMAVALKSLALDLDLTGSTKGEALWSGSEASAALASLRSLLSDLSDLAYSRLLDPKVPASEKLAAIGAGFDEARATALRLFGAALPPGDDGASKALDPDEFDADLFAASMALLDARLALQDAA